MAKIATCVNRHQNDIISSINRLLEQLNQLSQANFAMLEDPEFDEEDYPCTVFGIGDQFEVWVKTVEKVEKRDSLLGVRSIPCIVEQYAIYPTIYDAGSYFDPPSYDVGEAIIAEGLGECLRAIAKMITDNLIDNYCLPQYEPDF